MEIMMRRARMADAAAINDICNSRIGGEGTLEIDQRPVEYRQEWLAAHDRRHPVFVGTQEEKVVCWAALGYGVLEGYPFEWVASAELGLPPELEGSELTDLLLRFLEQQAARLGYYKLMACLPARQRYLLHAYRRAGFRDVGVLRGHGYCRGELWDMALMERLLTPDMGQLAEQYSRRYPFYKDYFEAERRRREEAAAGGLELEYEEVEAPEGQLPEGIVRFLRTKRDDQGRPVRRAPAPAPAGQEAPGQPREEKAPGSQSGLPEGSVRFLKSKRAPDGTPLDKELPPVVPVKLPGEPIVGRTMTVESGEPDGPEEETAPAPAGELALSEEEGEPEEQLGFDDYLQP